VLGRLRAHLSAQLEQGTPRLSEVAKQLAFGQRTLQRWLRQLGTSFGDILEAVRQEQYEALATSRERSPEELARALGYSDVRSLRRWRRGSSERGRKRASTATASRGDNAA
jgi:AraC-like DNA-binding protein